MADHREWLPPPGHRNWVLTIAWSPTGRQLASGDMDGGLMLWDASTKDATGAVLTVTPWANCG